MIAIGRIQELEVRRRTADLLVLGDGQEEVRLHASADPTGKARTMRVFILVDREGRKLATTRIPRIEAGGFALLPVHALRPAGALIDWGVEPRLLVPPAEQEEPLVEGRRYLVHAFVQPGTGQLIGSTRIDAFLDDREITVRQGDEVRLLVVQRSELGYSVIVNDRHRGLLHTSEVFRPVAIGDRLKGYVRTVREDGKLDITLQAMGYRQHIDGTTSLVADRIQALGGFLPLTDKSSAGEVYATFGISKKAFKQALGALYRQRLVTLEADGVRWIGRARKS